MSVEGGPVFSHTMFYVLFHEHKVLCWTETRTDRRHGRKCIGCDWVTLALNDPEEVSFPEFYVSYPPQMMELMMVLPQPLESGIVSGCVA